MSQIATTSTAFWKNETWEETGIVERTLLISWLFSKEKQHGFRVFAQQRVQVAGRRVRISDICLLRAEDRDEVTQHPPLLWIEVLSPEDRWSRIQRRLNDALKHGAPAPITLAEYMESTYEPDCDYVDGLLQAVATWV